MLHRNSHRTNMSNALEASQGRRTLPVPRYSERRSQFPPQPRIKASAPPRCPSHELHVVDEAPRRVAPVHIVHVCETVFTTALYRVVVRKKRV